jgi:serine/threonine protein kinase
MGESKGKDQSRVWLTTGTLVRNYVIEARIAASGMGEVYLAKERQSKRQVALKILPAPPNCSGEKLAALAEQMNRQACPTHPSIAETYEIGVTENGKLFIASEYVSGHSLDTLLMAKANLDVEKIAEQIALALQAAHEAGRVHADLKMSNVMVTISGKVKLLDFGLTKYKQLWQTDGENNLPQTEVQPSSLRHCAPEHVNGLPCTPQTDLFSLGTILYELLTGIAPFTGETPLKVCAAIVWQKPQSILDLVAEAPPAFCSTIHRLLEKNQAQRLPSTQALLAELREPYLTELESRKHLGAKMFHAGLAMRNAFVTDEGRMVCDFSRGFWHVLFNDGSQYVAVTLATLMAAYALLTFLSLIGLKH